MPAIELVGTSNTTHRRDWRILRRVLAPFLAFGPLGGALYAADRMLLRVSPRLRVLDYELMVQPIRNGPILPSSRSRNLRARELGPGDPDLDQVIAPCAVRASRFAQNATCLATYRGNRLVGYIWLCFDSYDEDEARCTYTVHPAGKAVFDFDLVVLPEFRMGLGFAAVWHCTAEYLRKRGVEFSFSRVTRINVISRQSHARLGSIRIGRMMILKLWSLEIFVTTTAPYIQLRGASGRALVTLTYRGRIGRRTSSMHADDT